MSVTKLRLLGRASRVRGFSEAQEQMDAVRAKIDEIIHALANETTDRVAVGGNATPLTLDATTTNTTSSSGHKHAITTAAQTGFYGTAATVGAGTGLQRASGVLVFPEALGTAADRTKTWTVTDSGTEGVMTLLNTPPSTASTIGNQRVMRIALPGAPANHGFTINEYGFIGAGDFPVSDSVVMKFRKLDFVAGAGLTAQGIEFSIRNTGLGGVRGINSDCSLQPSDANATAVVGNKFKTSFVNSSATGTMTGAQFVMNSTGAVAKGDILGLQVGVEGIIQGTFTNARWQRISGPSALATITTEIGLDIDTIVRGTTRRALRTTVTNESTAGDWLTSTAAKGPVMKDAQGTPRFWRWYADTSGTTSVGGTMAIDSTGFASFTRGGSAAGTIEMEIVDVGTTAPAA